MITEALIEQTLNEIFDNIEFASEPKGLYDPLRYMIGIGGKRIRPRLCLTAYSLYQDEFKNGIQDAAEALEVFHSFTLLHDDIMDNAPIRRGMETVWKKCGTNSAILSGDVMCIDSYRRLGKVEPVVLSKVLNQFSQMAAGVCEGQQLDMEFENLPKVEMKDYIRMIELKTAILIASSAKIGATIAGAPDEACEALFNYGWHLGLAFQIADDYLDTFGDKKVFGKAIGGDILNDKKTWLLTKAMEKDEKAMMDAMSLPVGSSELDGQKIEAVTALYRKLGVDEDAKCEILKYNSLAMKQLENIGLSKLKLELLARYADKLVGRTK